MELPKRKPTRLKRYDYSQNGYYFVTICTHNKQKILSDITVGEGFPLPQLTKQGMVAEWYLNKINEKYPYVSVHKYVIMPNHIHAILIIDSFGRGDPSPTISNVVGWLKYNITRQINKLYGVSGNKIFQRSFHDHIIRGQKDYEMIWNYIEGNPSRWTEDCFYIE